MKIVARNSLTLSNVNDGTITHTAYSYSVDGKDRFSTVYPKPNLLNGTKIHDIFKGTGTANAGGTQKYILDKGLKISDLKLSKYQDLIFEFDWKATGTNLSGYFLYQTQTYCKGTRVTISPTNTSGHVKNTFYKLPVTTDISTFMTIRQDNIPTTVTVEISNVMMYIVDYSPWMPSSTEVKTSDYPSYIGQYTNDKKDDKTNPSDYTWSLMRGNDGKDGATGKDGTSGIIVSSVAPDSPHNGQLWQDTSTTPQLVKKWTGASWVIWELYVENMNVNNLSALSPNLGNITGGSYTSWKYIGMYNAQGDTAMAGIYINEGVIRSLVVINSNTQDPNKPNAIEFARLEGSQTAFGSTNYYIDNTPIYKQFTLNEVLKGSQFWNTTKRADINTLAGSIVVGKDADSASSIFISAQNAYISRWSTDYSFVDVDMLETISSHKVLFDGGFDNRYDATNNRDTNTLSLGNLVGVKYLQIYVCVYQRLHIINLDISNTFSAFDGIWRYSTLYNAPERATLSPGTWRDWNMELLCNGAIADSQLRWGGMFFKETGGMGYRAADTSNMKNTFIYKIVGVY